MRTIDIPQANSINRVLAALAALDEGCATTAHVAAALGGLDPRLGDYYLHALRVLGLAFYARGVALRTTLGAELAVLPPQAQRQQLALIVAATPPMHEVLSLLERHADGVPLDEVAALLQDLARLSPSTARRRAQGLLSWLHTLQLAAPTGRRWRRIVAQPAAAPAPDGAGAADGPAPGPQAEPADVNRYLELGDPLVLEWLAACGIEFEQRP